jgi:DNA adenine methylase
MQLIMFAEDGAKAPAPFKTQLLKWVGNKQRFAHEIASYFPQDFGDYYEPFLGSGAVLATFSPQRAFASDGFAPLIEIWQTLRNSPERLKEWYQSRWERMQADRLLLTY